MSESAFSSKYSLILAYLFGSTVGGDAGRLSDIDIGVMVDENLTKIDLIILNEAPLLLE